MSCWGKSSDGMPRRSPCGFSPKFASYVIWAYLSQSDEKTHWAPADSKANRIPPIPQNKSINLGQFTLSHRTCKPKITQLGANVSGVLPGAPSLSAAFADRMGADDEPRW
jgi:hypothetical protein